MVAGFKPRPNSSVLAAMTFNRLTSRASDLRKVKPKKLVSLCLLFLVVLQCSQAGHSPSA